MQRERLTERIFVFRSDKYAQVTCGLILTDAGAVLIDALLYPDETRRIKRYVEGRLRQRVVCVVNTHYHADHTTGTRFFPSARVIAHRRCRELLDTRGRDGLQALQAESADFDGMQVALPHVAFDEALTMTVGDVTLRMWHSPGHSADQCVCLLEREEILFASDALLPLPFFADGDFDDCRRTLQSLRRREYENVVQGHGDIILRGELAEKIDSDLVYLERLESAVENCAEADLALLEARFTAEACGKSGALLGGAGAQLHRQNVRCMVKRRLNAIASPGA